MLKTKIKYLIVLFIFSTQQAVCEAPLHSHQENHSHEILVEASALNQKLSDLVAPVSVLSGEQLHERTKGSLGETLNSEPGVSSSYFGPTASRPVIRGLGGERIKVLENGANSQDLSAISPDHLNTIDPLLAEQIEVVRGPATILYGSNAIGGVVNYTDGRIPDKIPAKDINGFVETKGSTGDLERAVVGKFETSSGPLVFHFDGSARKTDDIEIPGFARTEREREEEPELEYPEPRGELSFSDSQTDQINIGTSYVDDKGFFGFSISDFNSIYGVPNGENDISIDADRKRFDLKGKRLDVNDYIDFISADLGIVDYEHTEFEGSEVGTKFSNDGLDARFEIAHSLSDLSGVFGFEHTNSDFKADGEEAYQPPTDTDIYSLFLFEEYPLNSEIKLQAGARVDWHSYDSAGFDDSQEIIEELGRNRADAISRNFESFSQSVGLIWSPESGKSWALSLANTQRAPTGQELFADGPHAATAAYEIGDPDLEREKSIGVDLTYKQSLKRVNFSVGTFYNRFSNFIGLNPDGTQSLDFDVYQFQNQDVHFYGAESKVTVDLSKDNDSSFSWDIQPDYVFAEDLDSNSALPRIPPFRVISGINYDFDDTIHSRLEVNFNNSQDRNAEFETETDAYTFINAFISKTFSINDRSFEVYLRGANLTNEKGRVHSSFIKDIAPLPGLSVTSGIRFNF